MIVFTIIILLLAKDVYGEMYASNIKPCNGPNIEILSKHEIKNITGGQAVKVDIELKKDFGNDNRFRCKAFKIEREGKARYVGNIVGKNACNTGNMWGGKYWVAVEKKANVEKPRQCPVPKKNYTLDWFPIIYSQIPATNLVPKGKYWINCSLYNMNDTDEKTPIGCISLNFKKN